MSATASAPAANDKVLHNWLPDLTGALASLDADARIPTVEFAAAVEKILPVFDFMGPVFSLARSEMHGKNVSLQKVAEDRPTLNDVVQYDVKNKTITVKGSCSRNLHRILTSIKFISELLKNLAKDTTMSLHTAAADAYDRTLSPVHSFVVRMAVKTGMYTLPTRANFLISIDEAGAHAKEHAEAFCKVADSLLASIEALFGNLNMPRSDSAWTT